MSSLPCILRELQNILRQKIKEIKEKWGHIVPLWGGKENGKNHEEKYVTSP